jgi:hypothetical protein
VAYETKIYVVMLFFRLKQWIDLSQRFKAGKYIAVSLFRGWYDMLS